MNQLWSKNYQNFVWMLTFRRWKHYPFFVIIEKFNTSCVTISLLQFISSLSKSKMCFLSKIKRWKITFCKIFSYKTCLSLTILEMNFAISQVFLWQQLFYSRFLAYFDTQNGKLRVLGSRNYFLAKNIEIFS